MAKSLSHSKVLSLSLQAYELAEEAKTAAKEAEAVAAAKQYHAAHLSSKKYSNNNNLTLCPLS